MDAPVFEEVDPGGDCECPGCVHRRRLVPYSARCVHLGRPAVRNAIVVATAAGAALGAGQVVPAVAAAPEAGPQTRPEELPATLPMTRPMALRASVPADEQPRTPQGKKAPLHGPGGRPADPEKPPEELKTPPITRAEIIRRARTWIVAEVPYSMTEYWSDGYRQDCSGFVSMAWKLPGNEWTGSLDKFAERISKDDLEPGDMLLFHNPNDPQKGSHVVIFGGWTDDTHTEYIAYESTRPHARRLVTPYSYWNNSSRYVPYRYKGLVEEGEGEGEGTADGKTGTVDSPSGPDATGEPGSAEAPGAKGSAGADRDDRYPGAAYFGPGADNRHVTRLGQLLVERGGGRFYREGPGPRWTAADGRATQAFQRAQGWSGRDADGLPGPTTWSYLVNGKGRDIPPPGSAGPAGRPATPRPSGTSVPPYPGRGMFRPGADNAHITRLGKQLIKKGFGKYYTSPPGSRWDESDRRNVEAFQRAQGWRGGAADGYPGPETWRRLFS
ncbi:peptidoglycan-binding protein [Streptomyces sp. NPDC002643]